MVTKTSLITGAILAITMAAASPALASSLHSKATAPTGATSAEIACVGKAVATRESAFDAGSNAYQTAMSSAYSTRAKSLASAYGTGTPTGVAAGIKTAWANFNASSKAASAAWSTKRLSVWASFKTSAAACKAPAGILDSSK